MVALARKTPSPKAPSPTSQTLFPEGEKQFRTALRTMEKDEAVLAVKVTDPGEDAGVASRLADGMRAFAIKRRRDLGRVGLPGPRRPGRRLLDRPRRTRRREGGAQDVTQLIQSNVHIIAIDQQRRPRPDRPARGAHGHRRGDPATRWRG